MAYTVVTSPKAGRRLKKLSRNPILPVVDQALNSLAEDPRPHGYDKLTDYGKGSFYRVRTLDYRITYTIDDDAKVVTIQAIEPRDQVYGKRRK